MACKELQRIFCLTTSLLALFLGACATTQNNDNGSPTPDVRTSEPDKALSARRQKQKHVVANALAKPHDKTPPKTYDDVWDRVRDGFRLRELDSPHVDYYVKWYAERPEYLERLGDRASLYLYYIVEELERNDIPMEIALLPAIESAYKPTAYSHAHASGLWQFISATGRRYGLKQNWWYDGRRDVVSATGAAIQYLSFLRDEFDGNWFHALAAYNTGERRVQRAILHNRRRGKSTAYEHLNLRRETERYIPKLLAIKRIVENGSQIDLSIVAEAAGISTSKLHELNPGFRRWATDPAGPHRVLVPAESRH